MEQTLLRAFFEFLTSVGSEAKKFITTRIFSPRTYIDKWQPEFVKSHKNRRVNQHKINNKLALVQNYFPALHRRRIKSTLSNPGPLKTARGPSANQNLEVLYPFYLFYMVQFDSVFIHYLVKMLCI